MPASNCGPASEEGLHLCRCTQVCDIVFIEWFQKVPLENPDCVSAQNLITAVNYRYDSIVVGAA